jgi:hypothetical protein
LGIKSKLRNIFSRAEVPSVWLHLYILDISQFLLKVKFGKI